jgi:DNA invertase Pin-like site-specific DNA recombinase
MKILGYARVSTIEQASEGMSMVAQENRIRSWAEAMGHDVIDVLVEEGMSGSKLLAERPKGKLIAQALDSRKADVDAVAVVRIDRLGRDAREQIALLKRFRTGKVGLVAIAQQIDHATPHGRAMAQIGAVFSELERSLIAERTVDAFDELRRQGKAWNHAAFGWHVIDGNLVVDDREQATLAYIRELRAKGLSYSKIAITLTAEGFSTKRGGTWQPMSVRSVLRTSNLVEALRR